MNPVAAAVAATQRSQARASSGEEASRAPRTWLVSNMEASSSPPASSMAAELPRNGG
uniref:Uncharacterized protein n=1 Tax=Arundo donax TaxID=35708 RepID=A0A0A9GZ42_ARUDO